MLLVKKRNKLVDRWKLAAMAQGEDAVVINFETSLKPVARTGRFKETCAGCGQSVEFTDQMVLDNLIGGLADEDIENDKNDVQGLSQNKKQ